MQVAIRSDSLRSELEFIKGALDKKSKDKAHGHILMETGTDEVRLTGADGGITIITHAQAQVFAPGARAITGSKLIEVVATLPPSAQVIITGADADRTTIKCERYQSTLAGLPRDRFPDPPQLGESTPSFTISAERLRMMINRTIFAITQEESRYTLSGAKLAATRDADRMVATDGHRLAYIEGNGMNRQLPQDIEVLVPIKALAELLKLTKAFKGDVGVRVGGNQIVFEVGRRQIISCLIAGQFPDYEKVIPKDNPLSAVMHCGTLKDALSRVELMTVEREHGINLHFAPGELVLQARNAEVGEANEVVEIEYGGSAFDIRLNVNYLKDFLQALNTNDAVEFQLKDSHTSVLTRPIGEAGITFAYVLAPMRL